MTRHDERPSAVTYQQIKDNPDIRTYIEMADKTLSALGFTEHSFAHVTLCAKKAGDLLEQLGYSSREVELARIAGFMHDIGNTVNRVAHAQSGAIMAFRILDKLGMPPAEIATVVAAIGNHDEGTAQPVNPESAALILADKSDVRRTRVRGQQKKRHYDIHDRVNYAVTSSEMKLSEDKKNLILKIQLDSSISDVMDYFEIFLGRMSLCKQAAKYLGLRFQLEINGVPFVQ